MNRLVLATAFLTCAAFSQAPAPEAAPRFEVAEIKPTQYTGKDAGKGRISGSRIDVPSVTLKSMIVNAYNVHESMVVGGPSWLDSDRFDIVAKAAPDTPPSQLQKMLRPLIEERFHLVMHREERPITVLEMTVLKNHKLQPASGGRPGCEYRDGSSNGVHRVCHNMSMEELANSLPRWGGVQGVIDIPVVDATGLSGPFDFELEWNPPEPGPGGKGEGAAVSAPEPGSTIFDALLKVGLKLERRKRPMQVIVIDRADRPTQN